MFSSNQALEISGSLSHNGELENALEFALRYYGSYNHMAKEEIEKGCKIIYQITKDGKYCIGWGFENLPKGWLKYPFDFKIETVSKIIREHLEKFDIKRNIYDGSYSKGFLMKCINESMHSEYKSIKNSSHCIVYFKPFTCFYSK